MNVHVHITSHSFCQIASPVPSFQVFGWESELSTLYKFIKFGATGSPFESFNNSMWAQQFRLYCCEHTCTQESHGIPWHLRKMWCPHPAPPIPSTPWPLAVLILSRRATGLWLTERIHAYRSMRTCMLHAYNLIEQDPSHYHRLENDCNTTHMPSLDVTN